MVGTGGAGGNAGGHSLEDLLTHETHKRALTPITARANKNL
jgi:hypothetical protein